MADTTQKQTAATGTPPGHKPADGGSKSPTAQPREASSNLPLDLDASLEAELGGSEDSEIDAELDGDLPKQFKKGKQASDTKGKKKSDEEEAEEESTDEESEEETEEEAEAEEIESEDDDESTDDEEEEDDDSEDDENLDEDVDLDKPPKGYEKVPKGIWKRHNKLRADNRALRDQLAAGPVILQATPDSPLSDVTDIETLDERVKQAREDRDWLEENPQGGSRQVNGKTVEVSEDEAVKLRKKSKLIIDSDAATRAFINERERLKPADSAAKLEPNLFIKGSAENNLLLHVVRSNPAITRTIPDWEKFVAYAARGMRQVIEENSGKAKYVRFEVGADGKLIAPKGVNGSGAAKAGAAKAKPDAETRKPPPSTPSQQRPPLRSKDTQRKSAPETRVTDNDADLGKQLAAELGED